MRTLDAIRAAWYAAQRAGERSRILEAEEALVTLEQTGMPDHTRGQRRLALAEAERQIKMR
jgi:hypothetical protein